MFCNDTDETLQAAQYRTMNHNRSTGRSVDGIVIFGTTVFQVEPNRELKVELDGGALERTTESVFYFDIDLGAVKSTITFVQGPFSRMELF